MRGGELRLAKTGSRLRFVWTWPGVDVTALDPAMVIICREPDGRWYVTFAVDAPPRSRCRRPAASTSTCA